MKALSYAIMEYFTTVEEACVNDVINVLKDAGYSSHKQLKPKSVHETLKTAVSNGLFVESRYDLDEAENLRIFYKITDYGKNMVTNFL